MDTRFSKKRLLIIRAAALAFGRKGFHPTTLDQIAADLQVTKPSLYYYFSTKEELLFEVHRSMLEDLAARVDRIVKRESSPVARLQAVVSEHLEMFAGDYEGAFLLQQEYELPAVYREPIIALRDAYERRIVDIVEQGTRERVFRVKDVRLAVRIMLGGLNWFVRWYRASGRFSVAEIAEAYMDFFLYGLLASPSGTLQPTTVRPRAPRQQAAARSRVRRKGQ